MRCWSRRAQRRHKREAAALARWCYAVSCGNEHGEGCGADNHLRPSQGGAVIVDGSGLLIHDAYRPWYVTKIFWDATPAEKKWLVANPARGSLHNRGCAVDLTLYDLKTGQPVEMVSTYDESTDRAFAEYPGGTSLQRWHRALLRSVMEAQGFTANPQEWWHFDYKDWRDYPIMNVTFEQISATKGAH